jgi:hypothetical protein
MTEVRMIYSIARLIAARQSGDSADVSIARSHLRIWIRAVYHLDLQTARGFVSM